MERVDFSEDKPIAELRRVLEEKGMMQSSSRFRYQLQNITNEEESIRSIGCKNGDIIEIKDSLALRSTNTTSRTKVRLKSEGPRTLDDIKEMKAKLLKITSQKLKQETYVSISSRTGTSSHLNRWTMIQIAV